MQRVCITGGAGFIGSNLADAMSAANIEVVVVDDYRTGRHEFVESLLAKPSNRLVEGDILDSEVLVDAFEGCDWVFHLAANADVRHGLEHPTLDLQQNAVATSRVLEAMRAVGVSRIAFSSTGSIYGEPNVFPTPEDAPFPVQTSLYGASKLAAEGLIQAYASGFGFTGVIFRFVSILGERYTHGHVYDFFRALRRDPQALSVLGDGLQQKSYLYVQDCIAAMLLAVGRHDHDTGAFLYNLGHEETLLVRDSVEIITERMDVNPQIHYGGGQRGWVGDSPLIQLDTSRIRSLGWKPTKSIYESVELTVDWLEKNQYAWQGDEPS
jgi:UDP-glucose 4-epimerase